MAMAPQHLSFAQVRFVELGAGVWLSVEALLSEYPRS
jgi:hypothetical protein